MNTKEMISSIVTAMMVMTMFASSAMAAIMVDGKVDPSTEWDTYDEKIVDVDPSAYPVCSTGYNITSLWMRVEGDTLFIRMDVEGTPGDADNDGDPDTNTSGMSCSCGWDYVGVGVGALCTREQYLVEIDGDNDSDIDYILKYCSGGSSLYTESDVKIFGAHTDAEHGTIVEFSVDIDPDYCYINPANYCVQGWADTQCNGNEDPVDKICHFNPPPEANFTFTPGDCGKGRLDATASTDADGWIVSYEWDFDGDGDYDDANGSVVDPYTIGGTRDVCLKVTDNLGQPDTLCKSVTLTGCPIAVAKANGDGGPTINLQDGGEMVEFSGADSYHPDYPDANITSYAWVIGSKTSDLCTVSYFIGQDTTATLTVTDNFGCPATDTITLIVPPEEVPILTPAGMVALIGMLCIVGAGRILTKGRRS
jgi:hypothetical protein